jgi:hypothetical protein
MKVEILYFAGCPNHRPAVARVREILRQETVSAELVEIEVKDPATAQEAEFLGSPSIRIDGWDIEPSARSSRAFGFGCRTYPDEGRRAGVPPLEWIRAAVQEARCRKHETKVV